MADEEGVEGDGKGGEGAEGQEPGHPEEVEDEHAEEESILTEYDPDDFISGAVTSPESTIPSDMFDFEYSYGYNCHKFFNLCACDDMVICFSSGSIITFLDVNTKQTWFRRSSTGGTVGSITSYRTDPNYRIAIAEDRENEREPIIILYTWPQMEIDAVLRDGTANAYAILDFSPDGELLASVGKEPDFNLTIWNWKFHKILLRTSAFTYGVNSVMFSPYCEGQLTTSGAAHIKFWKMAQTFTGLKLKGELGRFGKTEICDVLGVYPMPDEKVLSGCEWGNILVWEAGLVKIEVTRKGRKFCHTAPIIQFMLSPSYDEVTTIARDGCVRAWYWDTVDQADPPEEDPFIELNPVAETCVPDCQIMCLKHRKDMFWYAQDGNGGIWIVDLEIDKLECDHLKVLTCHAGGVVAMAALRTHPILITAGEDGTLQAYNTITHKLLARYLFLKPVSCMLYPPLDVDSTSCILIVGFADGIMRTLMFHPELLEDRKEMIDIRVDSTTTIHSQDSENPDVMDMISLLKPHSKAISQISINIQRTLLVTCGEDSTIFMYKLTLGTPFTLDRIGFIETPNKIAYMTWKPEEERVLLLCGQVGLVMETVLPEIIVRKYSEITTFKLEFVSYKETLVKKHYMRHRPFPEEEDLASIDEEALKAKEEAEKDEEEEEGEWIGEVELMESESMLGTTISWADYCEEGVWVVQRGTGALYLIRPGHNKILKYAPFPGAWCETLTTLKFICDRRYLVVGTDMGIIRVVRMPTEEEDNPTRHYTVWMNSIQKLLKKLKGRRLAKEEKQPIPRIDFVDFYYLPMHDHYTGAITCLELSHNSKRMYTSGADGNIFAYNVNFPQRLLPKMKLPPPPESLKLKKEREPSTVEGELMSHEELKQKEEYDKMMAIANAHKKRVRDQLSSITLDYNKLIKANRALPYSQQIDETLDPRPLEVQEKELNEAKALTVRKLAHQLEASDLGLKKMHSRNIIMLDVFPFTLRAIRDPKVMLRPLRQKNLSKAFYAQLEEVYQKMAEAALKGRHTESTVRRLGARRPSYGPPRVASFLLGLPPKPPYPLKKALKNYHVRLNRHHIQFIEWQEHLNRKPDPTAMPPGAAEALKEAEATIGNRILKTQPDYVAPPGHNTQIRVCLTRKEIYDLKHEFNEKVLELRERKVQMTTLMKEIGERLLEIRIEIPPKLVKHPPPLPQFDDDLEFPERHLEVNPEPIFVSARTMSSKKSLQLQGRRKTTGAQQVARIVQPRVQKFLPINETRPLVATWELLKVRQDQESTPLETEVRERRVERHLFEQDMLLREAEAAVDKFDSRMRELQRERIRVQERDQLLELHLYQLHREMNVLNRFEMHEDRLAERVYTKLMQVRGVQEQIADCEHRIEMHITEKEELDLVCQELQRKFKRLVQDNKFADFLRRIFKKKYRPPRVRDDDDSSESESSESSSEEEEEGSLDSRDIGPIRLDPNICPEGCEREIYDQTYEMRNTRHKHEQDMLEQDRLVELLKRDIEAHNKIKRKLSVQLEARKNELREFMLEKQSCMNEVDSVIVLRYDQIRAAAIEGCTSPKGLSEVVVFPEALLARLRKRVLEIQEEIRMQRLRQKINRTHLFRMNVDLKAMEAEAEDLRAQMRDVLTRKLGKPRKVDKTLDDQLRQMARRHKYSVNYAALPHVVAQLRTWRERHSSLEKKYLAAMNQYSDRLRLAAALQGEVLPKKSLKRPSDKYGYNQAQYQRDVSRLLIVRQRQRQQIKQLQEEIHNLRLKPLSELAAMPPSAKPPKPQESDIRLFMVPRAYMHHRRKYFPTAPLVSQLELGREMNVTNLLFDCLDAMRVTRDDAEILLRDVMDRLPEVMTGKLSRYDLVDTLVRKWLLKFGGDPSQYKKQTRAFDALAALTDRLVKQQIEAMESPEAPDDVIDNLEEALKDVSDENAKIEDRVGPAIAALLHSARAKDIDDPETMASLVRSLVDDEHPITMESIERICSLNVQEDIRDCGITLPNEELEHIVAITIDALKAQIIERDEAARIAEEVEEALKAKDLEAMSRTSILKAGPSRTSSRRHELAGREPSKVEFTSSTTELHDTTDHDFHAAEGLHHISSVTSFSSAKVEIIPTTRRTVMSSAERQSFVSRISASILKQDTDSKPSKPTPPEDIDDIQSEAPEQKPEEKEASVSGSKSDTHQ
ncbi:hypothetical protein PYW08_002177 [Mythimna loreyi]|uniref:Uncharacterized protein n=1 Tax=Mythimna loreyi TaxID=667449 RepID=A0ACC2R289_9NEOP|nr:hypothetical protein PYW08_002177 [Mythimna loreyi]